jgi:hypothetical protein
MKLGDVPLKIGPLNNAAPVASTGTAQPASMVPRVFTKRGRGRGGFAKR